MSAICQPNIAKSIAAATSLMSGDAIRNENVIPSGTPLSTKPMKSGTAEQEQNGVGMPRRAASTLPTPSVRPATHFFTCCGVIYDPDNGNAKHDHGKQQRDLDRVVDEEVHGRGEGTALHQPED